MPAFRIPSSAGMHICCFTRRGKHLNWIENKTKQNTLQLIFCLVLLPNSIRTFLIFIFSHNHPRPHCLRYKNHKCCFGSEMKANEWKYMLTETDLYFCWLENTPFTSVLSKCMSMHLCFYLRHFPFSFSMIFTIKGRCFFQSNKNEWQLLLVLLTRHLLPNRTQHRLLQVILVHIYKFQV